MKAGALWCEQYGGLRIDRSPWVPVQQLPDALWRLSIESWGRATSSGGSPRRSVRHLGDPFFLPGSRSSGVTW